MHSPGLDLGTCWATHRRRGLKSRSSPTSDVYDQVDRTVRGFATFKERRMHIEGLVELAAVNGLGVKLEREPILEGASIMGVQRFRELAPKPKQS